jgi:hypothetical protein
MIPLEDDGTPHQCPNSPYNQNLKNATTTVAAAATQQVQPQPQQQVQRDTGYPNFRVTQEDWDFVKSAIMGIKHQQDRLSEVYNDLSDHYRAISSMIKHEQKMADAETTYDQDEEQGLA